MKYYIYGAGNNLEKVVNCISGIIDITAIIDRDETKVGKKYGIIDIISTKEYFETTSADKKQHKIILTVTNSVARIEIEKMLDEKGCDYIRASEFCCLYDEIIPGTLTGVRHVPNDNYKARPSFDPNSYLMIDTLSNRLFRIFKKEKTEEVLKILEGCNSLLGSYIVNSWVDNTIEGMDDSMVIEHEYLSPISFCYEWSPSMYEDYVFFMFELIRKLAEANMGLVDAHGLNATFCNGKFVFYDFGAICIGKTSPIEMLTAMNVLVLPLLLIKIGETKKAYLYLEDHGVNLTLKDIMGYLQDDELIELRRIYTELIFDVSRKKLSSNIDDIVQYINKFRKNKLVGDWEDYQDSEWTKDAKPDLWSVKMRNVFSMIESIKPKTIIDIAGNQGWYGSCYRNELDYAIIVDMDVAALDKLWQRIKDKQFTNVIPLKMSICAPSLGRHFDGFVDGKTVRTLRKSGKERLSVELAIALAIIHHLAFRECLSFDEIISLLKSYTEKYLIVEFVDQADRYIDYFKKDGFEWYTRENFECSLKKQFEIIHIMDSSPCDTRTIYLCKAV